MIDRSSLRSVRHMPLVVGLTGRRRAGHSAYCFWARGEAFDGW